jgi:hypothetical protein
VVSPVVRLVFSPAPAVNSADVDDKAMAAIGQRVVAEAPCVALEVVAEEQVFEAIDIPVVPIAPVPQRGWAWWCVGAALSVCNMIVNDRPVFFEGAKFLNSKRGCNFENISERSWFSLL